MCEDVPTQASTLLSWSEDQPNGRIHLVIRALATLLSETGLGEQIFEQIQLFNHLASVRINGGESSGIVEVLIDGEWRWICGSGWDDIDAQVVCRQLGYT